MHLWNFKHILLWLLDFNLAAGYLRIFYQFHEQIYSDISKTHFEKKFEQFDA